MITGEGIWAQDNGAYSNLHGRGDTTVSKDSSIYEVKTLSYPSVLLKCWRRVEYHTSLNKVRALNCLIRGQKFVAKAFYSSIEQLSLCLPR